MKLILITILLAMVSTQQPCEDEGVTFAKAALESVGAHLKS
jgi:hypothetical protein